MGTDKRSPEIDGRKLLEQRLASYQKRLARCDPAERPSIAAELERAERWLRDLEELSGAHGASKRRRHGR